MALISEINSQNWSISKDTQGAIVTDIEDIDQCIKIIVTTVKRTDPLRLSFGCGMWEYIDKPVNVAIPNMIREIGLAIEEFEQRATITKITYELIEAEVIFSIHWASAFGNSTTNINVNL